MNTATHTFADGTPVYALIPHGGLFRRQIRAGHPGTTIYTRADRDVVVRWANGRTTTVPAAWITASTRADIDPHFAALIENALTAVDPNPDTPNASDAQWEAGWEDGWRSALEAVRERLMMDGLIHEED